MQHLFTPQGDAALAALLRRRPLFGFDFDGTLAPIVDEPAAARIPPAVTGRLRLLAELAPVVVISGRAIDDLRQRLGFVPRHVVGSHGAEDPLLAPEATAGEHAAALDPLREHLRRHAAELAAVGVDVEDKRQSIALHYRRAAAPARARSLLERLLEEPPGRPKVFAGKRVYNATAPDAPDKAGALRSLLARCDADCAVFAGDDVNDEPVFAAAPADWVTVHVGRGPSQARFWLDGPRQMVGLLERVLQGLRSAQE
ncbi:MAG: trehalose-phosphatase [Rubrivivax sp.]|nr:trehalose-phosphatase [Rubrivivax sp.]